MKSVILASTSPRRQELLKLIVPDFKIKASNYEEDNTLTNNPEELVLYHSLNKAKDVAKNYSKGLIIAGDTVVAYNGKILGKPHTQENAKKILEMIQNQKVDVITGLAVIDAKTGKTIQRAEYSAVFLKPMSTQDIQNYIETKEPLDRAGAFDIEGHGAKYIKETAGDDLNTRGMPLKTLKEMIDEMQ